MVGFDISTHILLLLQFQELILAKLELLALKLGQGLVLSKVRIILEDLLQKWIFRVEDLHLLLLGFKLLKELKEFFLSHCFSSHFHVVDLDAFGLEILSNHLIIYLLVECCILHAWLGLL